MPEPPALLPSASFRYCPRCGRGPSAPAEAPVFSCPGCGFHYHFNPAVAAGVIAEDREGRVLLVRREKEPARGRLGVPGGFVDIGETAEASARREAREETGIEVEGLLFLGSWPNLYEWRGVVYPGRRPLLHRAGRRRERRPRPATRSRRSSGCGPRRSIPRRWPSRRTRAALARYREMRRRG